MPPDESGDPVLGNRRQAFGSISVARHQVTRRGRQSQRGLGCDLGAAEAVEPCPPFLGDNTIPVKPLLLNVETQPLLPFNPYCLSYITQDLGGDYLFGLKGNQSGILDKAQHLLSQQGFPPSGCLGEGTRTL